MKKIISIAIAVAVVVSMAALATAADPVNVISPAGSTIKLSGDARVRGLWSINNDFNKDDDSDNVRLWDQRYRLVVEAKNAGGASATVRIVNDEDGADQVWDGAAANEKGVTADRAWIVAPVGPATVTIGRQEASWGNRLAIWDETRDRFKATMKVGQVTVGFLYDKLDEVGRINGDANLKDYDDYGLLAILSNEKLTAGVLGVLYTDNRRSQTTGIADNDAANFRGNDSQKRWLIDLYATAKAGPATVKGEFVYQNNFGRLANTGTFVEATMAAGPATVRGVVAHATGGFKADDDFIPVNMVGTDNPWGVLDFGGTPVGATSQDFDSSANKYRRTNSNPTNNDARQNEGKSSTLIGIAASMKVADKVVVGADAGYISDPLTHNAYTVSGTATYQIGENVSWTGLVGMFDGGANHQKNNWYQKGDANYVIGHVLSLTF